MSAQREPVRVSRPHIPDYGIPDNTDGVLPWSFVVERMEKARNYWVSTTRPDGRPHATPVWGVWVEGRLIFGGGPDTRRAQNIAQNPQVSVHLESGDEVVIIEGTATEIHDKTEMDKADDVYEVKYNMRHGPHMWELKPRIALAWTKFPDNTTRFHFEQA
jgi:PPOX class probable F420-dependent enzyme